MGIAEEKAGYMLFSGYSGCKAVRIEYQPFLLISERMP